MDRFVTRQNIDHFLELLRAEAVPETRHALNSLLIEEEDKMSRDQEHLDFAESRAAKLRQNFVRMTTLRDGFADGSSERELAEKMLANFEITLKITEDFCLRMRKQVDGSLL